MTPCLAKRTQVSKQRLSRLKCHEHGFFWQLRHSYIDSSDAVGEILLGPASPQTIAPSFRACPACLTSSQHNKLALIQDKPSTTERASPLANLRCAG